MSKLFDALAACQNDADFFLSEMQRQGELGDGWRGRKNCFYLRRRQTSV